MSIETTHVKEVYDKIATHFDQTRFNVWPSVQQFIDSISARTIVLDVGCGNGKNMCRKDIYFIGSDFCQNFAQICQTNGKNVLLANSKSLPIKDNCVDHVICVAMLHHIYHEKDRIRCLQEMYRVLKFGGKLLVTVWEQGDKPTQDNMITWKLQKKYKISKDEPDTYERYYHLFSENELLNLIETHFKDKLKVLQYLNDYGNWIITCQKTRV